MSGEISEMKGIEELPEEDLNQRKEEVARKLKEKLKENEG